MGRKIPAKKHRGVKDPLEQNARRLQLLKTKINAPPKDPDEQPVPRSLIDLFAFRDRNKKRDNKKPKPRASKGVERFPYQISSKLGQWLKHEKVTDLETLLDLSYSYRFIGNSFKCQQPKLRKLPGESGRDFSLRINGAIRALHESTEPQDYPQDLEEHDVKGERMAAQRERRERKRRRAASSADQHHAQPTLSRAQRFALKKKEKKMRALNARESDAPVYERVPFGEASHAPPALTLAHHKTQGAPRPGRRDLLLSQLLAGGGERRARLPAERLRLDRARLDAIAAYRALKRNPNK